LRISETLKKALTSQDPIQTIASESKKPSTKQTKAQKRAAQAEFNRQLWAEAYVTPRAL